MGLSESALFKSTESSALSAWESKAGGASLRPTWDTYTVERRTGKKKTMGKGRGKRKERGRRGEKEGRKHKRNSGMVRSKCIKSSANFENNTSIYFCRDRDKFGVHNFGTG